MSHRWHFFRAGGVDQVSLRDGKDLLALRDLDQKLWVALAMPVQGTAIDADTLKLIDLDDDGRVRVQDVLAAIAWVEATFKNPDDILRSKDSVRLAAIKDAKVCAAAMRMLKDLGKADADEIGVADASAITAAFAATVLNGDGIVIPESAADDADVKQVIEDAIATIGSATDRSGKPGIDQARADELFAAVDARVAWLARGKAPELQTLGDRTDAASTALLAVRAKLEDFFTRCRIAAFDPRGVAALGGKDDELAALASRSLTAGDDELAKLPIGRIDPAGRLPLRAGVNPAWAARLQAFVDDAVVPVLGARDALTADDLAAIVAKLAPYDAWRFDETKTKVDALAADWLETLAGPDLRAKLKALIASEAALAEEYAQITSVEKAVRLQRDGGRVLRNFVNFSDFYARQDGTFQAGTLYLDARALRLCVPVADVAKHAALATAADAYLAYCEITRKGEKRHIAAALTNGDSDHVVVGRNGIFYDRDGKDWDATITKIIANPISIRQAFWSPYKKLVRMVEDTVAKRAAAADAEATAKAESAGKAVASADQTAAAAAAKPAAPGAKPEPKKLDLGTVAAIGLAIGGVGTLVGALLASVFGLGKWLPLGILGILLMISGPAMLLAWLKLRRRNLGPILDANGWAINGRARINVAFGAAMTELAALPKGSQRTLDDPFADKKSRWKLWLFLIILLALAGTWYVGKLDGYLPERVRSIEVLGDSAPAAKRAKEEAAAAAAAKAAAAPAAAAPAPAAPAAPAPAAPAPATPAPAPAP